MRPALPHAPSLQGNRLIPCSEEPSVCLVWECVYKTSTIQAAAKNPLSTWLLHTRAGAAVALHMCTRRVHLIDARAGVVHKGVLVRIVVLCMLMV